MLNNEIQIRAANLTPARDELIQISSILHECAEEMAQRGESRWDLRQLEPSTLEKNAEANELYVLKKNGHIVGTFKLELEDTLFWPEMPPGEAVYVHKIGLSKEVRGQNLTEAIIRWSKDYAHQKGRKYLRLDTDHKRPGLVRLYEKLGFSRHSFKKLDFVEVIRFQMEV